MFNDRTSTWGEQSPAERTHSANLLPTAGWVLAGLAVAGLTFLALRHFGPDFRRYLKMEMM
jgi:hypothetical protein